MPASAVLWQKKERQFLHRFLRIHLYIQKSKHIYKDLKTTVIVNGKIKIIFGMVLIMVIELSGVQFGLKSYA